MVVDREVGIRLTLPWWKDISLFGTDQSTSINWFAKRLSEKDMAGVGEFFPYLNMCFCYQMLL